MRNNLKTPRKSRDTSLSSAYNVNNQQSMNGFKTNMNLTRKKETSGISLERDIKVFLRDTNKKRTIMPRDPDAVKKEYEQQKFIEQLQYYRTLDWLILESEKAYRKRELILSQTYFNDVLKLAHLQADLEVLFIVHKLLSFIWREVDDYQRQKQNLVLLKDIAGMMKNKQRKNQAYEELGICYMNMKEYEKALKCFKKQLEYAWINNDTEFEIRAYEKISMQYFYLGDLQKSKYYHQRAIRGQIIGDDLRRVFQRQSENMKIKSDRSEYNYEEDNTIQRKYLTSVTFTRSLQEIQNFLQLGYIDDLDEDEEYNNFHDYNKTPADVYSEHLSKNIGPIIRIGTPVSDIQLKDLPSPRGIKDSDINDDQENKYKPDEEDVQLLTPRTIKIQRLKVIRSQSQQQYRNKEVFDIMEKKEKKINLVEIMRERRQQRQRSYSESKVQVEKEMETKQLYDKAALKKQDQIMNQRSHKAILNHMSNQRNMKFRNAVEKGNLKQTEEQFIQLISFIKFNINYLEKKEAIMRQAAVSIRQKIMANQKKNMNHQWVPPSIARVEKTDFIMSYFQREKAKLETVKLSATVKGVYSLPEAWKQKIDDPQEQTYQYEVTIQGMKFQGGKVQPRQLTEEEKAELEAAKTKKPGGAPPKDDKKKKGQEEEISPEEKARLEQEAKEKEEKLQYAKDYWNITLNDQDRFQYWNEDPFREPSVKWTQKDPEGNPINLTQSVDLTGEELRKFEVDVNEKSGCWLYFDKLPPPEEEDPKAKGKAPPKGKANVEEVKPVHGRAWIDFTQLGRLGEAYIDSRFLIQTVLKLPEGQEPQPSDYVFENSQTYISIQVYLTEALNPSTGYWNNQGRDDIINGITPKYLTPTTDQIITEFNKELGSITKEISMEYTRSFSGEGADDKDSPRGKPSSTVYQTAAQQREVRENRKEKFILEFSTNPKYFVLRDKLKKAILRIAADRYKKKVGNKGLTQAERDKFKAELYCFLNNQMRSILPEILNYHSTEIHQDIIQQKQALAEDKNKQLQKTFSETEKDKYMRLFQEFDNMGDKENAEKQIYTVLSMDGYYDSHAIDYGKFALRYGNYLKAIEHFKNKISFNSSYWQSTNIPDEVKQKEKVVYAALLVQQNYYREAMPLLNELLDTDWKNISTNVLMGLLYEKLERPGLSRKHFAIAKCKRLRELNLLQPKSSVPKNFRTQNTDYKIEQVDYVMTKDQQLSFDQSDQLYFEFIEMLLEYNIADLADFALNFIKDKNSDRYLMTISRIKVMQGKYVDAVNSLDRLLLNDSKNQKAWILRGHAFYLNKNLFDSEESYIKALRIKPTPKDPLLQERLGIVYAKRKAWKDARVVFMKCCKEFTSTTSWIYLGLSLLRLGELSLAEDAFTQANILDNINPKIWGYMTVLCLTVGKERLVQAELCFKEALKTGLNDVEILEEIGDLYVREGQLPMAVQAYSELVRIDEKHGEGWQKLGDVNCNNQNLNLERVKAIECYKKAIELIEGEGNKQKMALTLQEILQAENREDEIEPYRKYLMEQSLTN